MRMMVLVFAIFDLFGFYILVDICFFSASTIHPLVRKFDHIRSARLLIVWIIREIQTCGDFLFVNFLHGVIHSNLRVNGGCRFCLF